MNFTRWIHNHTRSILFLLGALAIAGAVNSISLPVSLFPQVSFPRIQASLDAGDQPAERTEVEVTRPIEEAVRSIPGLRGVRSTTSRGSADISIDFDWGNDMGAALLQVESAINKVLPNLPAGTTFEVRRMDPTVFPVTAYSLTSSARSLIEIRDAAQYVLRPALSTVEGVSKVDVQGGATGEYRVEADPAKLQAYKMSLSDVATALSAANVLTAVGKLEDQDKLYLIISDTRFETPDQIKATVLRSGPGGIVRLEDVATVELAPAPAWTRVTADGRDAVLMQVYQQPGSNTVQIAHDIKAKIAGLRGQIPQGIQIANWYDQSDLIVASAHSVFDAVLIGGVLAALVLLIFLRNWKVTFIAMLTVPASLAATVLLLSILHMSFNIMTLGGMAAAVGLIIDDAIVMIEHIIRRLHGAPGDARNRVMIATEEFTAPLAGSSASTIIIFAPLAFLTGVTGAFFKALSITMASSLFISFLIAWLAVPLLAAKFLGEKDIREKHEQPWFVRIQNGYEKLMRRVLARPALVFLGIVPLLLAGYFAFAHVGSGFMPTMDEGGFILDYKTDPGTSLTETDRLLRQVETILRATPEVDTYSRRTGLQLGGGITEANTGDFFVRLKPLPRRDIEEVMDDVREQVEKSVPGLDIETAQLMEDLIGDLTSVPQPIEIKLFSDDEKTLGDLAPKIAAAIQKVPGVVEVLDGIVPAGDAMNIQVDRVKAALEGMDADAITKFLDDYLTGPVTTKIQQGPKLIGVHVWTPQKDRASGRDLQEMLLRAPDGHLFPLKRVATITTITGQPEITRENLKRMVAVTGRITGRDLGSTVRDIQRVLNQNGTIPAGVTYTLGGLYEQQQIAFRGLRIVLLSAIVLVFLLLLFLYERFRVAFAMLAIPLLAVAGVYIGLWITGTEFNITSRMGMTMIVGIVTEVTIFYYSEFHELPAEMNPFDRLILAGRSRMRPIAMTTFAAILALLPLALGIGQGSAMQKPLAIAIIAGLIAQLPLTLIVMPALLVMMRFTREKPAASV